MTMYIEMIDETNQVSEGIKNQTLDILEFAAQKTGKEDKEMAVTFVTNERSHELNLKYRDTNRPTDVISLEYKPESSLSFDEEDLADDPDLAEVLTEFDAYIGELFISVDKAREQAQEYGHSFEREMGFLAVHGFLHINGYDHYTPQEEKEMFSLQEEILDAYGLKR
ncbi:putative rRNA maturation factor [Streptococcus mutans PKUSS-LG01]|nr:putative rRNA maturation factor [Streptococcus mutans PKUSS-LG01]